MLPKILVKVDTGKNRGIAKGLIKTARGYPQRYFSLLGKKWIAHLSRNQDPGKIIIAPAFGIRKFEANLTSRNVPGKVFTITCTERVELDDIGRASVAHALSQFEIGRIEVHGATTDKVSGTRRPPTEFPVLAQLAEIDSEFGLGLGLGGKSSKVRMDSHEYYLISHTPVSLFTSLPREEKSQIYAAHNINGKRSSLDEDPAIIAPTAQALVIQCPDSRVMAQRVFEGHEVAVVSTPAGILSQVALDAIEAAVEKGVPAIVFLGHSNCEFVAAALEGDARAHLSGITDSIQGNIDGWEGHPQMDVEMENAAASAEMLRGERTPEFYPGQVRKLADRIFKKGIAVFSLYLDLSSGEVKGEL